MSHQAIVLGCGLVGATIAKDLSGDAAFTVTVADVNPRNFDRLPKRGNLKSLPMDLSDAAAVGKAVSAFDIVLGALPSRFGFQTLRAVIEAGKPYADISFMPEDAMELDALARQRGVAAVVDCGVAPGMSNLIVGHFHRQLDRTDRAAIYVGGLPFERRWPFQYKAPFAPSDVIEEYTRTSRYRVDGKMVERPALSEPELLDFDRVGTLEAFNTDGLRSLLRTLPIPTMVEKTLRYPGHAEIMRIFRETGLFSTAEIDVRGARIRPLDVTSALLFPKWTHAPGEREFTVMRVIVEGSSGGIGKRHTVDLFDETDTEAGNSSMARTTAFPCAIAARLLAAGTIKATGVLPPELLARENGAYETIMAELAKRGVRYTHSESTL